MRRNPLWLQWIYPAQQKVLPRLPKFICNSAIKNVEILLNIVNCYLSATGQIYSKSLAHGSFEAQCLQMSQLCPNELRGLLKIRWSYVCVVIIRYIDGSRLECVLALTLKSLGFVTLKKEKQKPWALSEHNLISPTSSIAALKPSFPLVADSIKSCAPSHKGHYITQNIILFILTSDSCMTEQFPLIFGAYLKYLWAVRLQHVCGWFSF